MDFNQSAEDKKGNRKKGLKRGCGNSVSFLQLFPGGQWMLLVQVTKGRGETSGLRIDRTRENHPKVHQGRFSLDIRKSSFTQEGFNTGTDTPGKWWSPWRSQKTSRCDTFPGLQYGNGLALWVCKTRPQQEIKHKFFFCSFPPCPNSS